MHYTDDDYMILAYIPYYDPADNEFHIGELFKMDSDDRSETAPFYCIPIVDESESDEYESPVLSEETLVGNLISADKAAYNKMMREWIADLCEELPLLERKVLIYSYGLFDRPQLTRRELAYWIGKTEKTISATLRRAEIKVIAKGASSSMIEFRRLWRKVDERVPKKIQPSGAGTGHRPPVGTDPEDRCQGETQSFGGVCGVCGDDQTDRWC